ncbi:pre-mRNA 3' end processing protein WDR33-like [Acinonyx jubatus]|uniref:Pre-mRNA 3' end processing protein WDR33-like n=1 Tax=Acinonyx jubatus TaxID=32536 RepID=A0ABM3NPC0_ACIJB|nr:pre-mRNA 3' end processing protein WDR33-like [Acinonyx jubatus]
MVATVTITAARPPERQSLIPKLVWGGGGGSCTFISHVVGAPAEGHATRALEGSQTAGSPAPHPVLRVGAPSAFPKGRGPKHERLDRPHPTSKFLLQRWAERPGPGGMCRVSRPAQEAGSGGLGAGGGSGTDPVSRTTPRPPESPAYSFSGHWEKCRPEELPGRVGCRRDPSERRPPPQPLAPNPCEGKFWWRSNINPHTLLGPGGPYPGELLPRGPPDQPLPGRVGVSHPSALKLRPEALPRMETPEDPPVLPLRTLAHPALTLQKQQFPEQDLRPQLHGARLARLPGFVSLLLQLSRKTARPPPPP